MYKYFRILVAILLGLIAMVIGYKICVMVGDWYGYPITKNDDAMVLLLTPFFLLGIYLGNGCKWPDDDPTTDGNVFFDTD